jgi:hypothetical protein
VGQPSPEPLCAINHSFRILIVYVVDYRDNAQGIAEP